VFGNCLITFLEIDQKIKTCSEVEADSKFEKAIAMP
jgi:hypothetical protein